MYDDVIESTLLPIARFGFLLLFIAGAAFAGFALVQDIYVLPLVVVGIALLQTSIIELLFWIENRAADKRFKKLAEESARRWIEEHREGDTCAE